MKHDGKLSIATGFAANSKKWKNKSVSWSKIVAKLSSATKTSERFAEYCKASRAEKSKIKDVGGYVGAYLRGGRRKQENVVSRQLVTLDIDYATLDFYDDFCLQFGNAAIVHSTHSHSEDNPRYRLIMPLSREVSPDEYVAISRKIAEIVDIEVFDDTTYEPHRLMFWASVSKDMDYYFKVQDGDWIDADEVLAMYKDWTDTSLWALSSRQRDLVKKMGDKQEDPDLKKGMVGAFCRAYTIEEAIAAFLPEAYIETDGERYTYTGGSTSGGLVIYEHKFAFSHHGTDPISGKLCNAFDLVRVHLYGHLDEGSKAKGGATKSYKAMEDLCRQDKTVKKLIADENIREAKYDFADDYEEPEETDEEDSLEWATELEVDTKGKYLSSANNLNLIVVNDARLKGVFKLNTFDNKRYVFRSVPWRKVRKPEPVKNVDYSGVRNYIESVYGIVGNLKIDDALALEFERSAYNPIKDYLSGLVWDGEPRVETLLIDYLGAEDSLYTRESSKVVLSAAVARIFKPGVKFDLVLTLVGDQGTGKSTLASKLGREWFSDTFITVQGKGAFEQLQGAWVIEMAELAGLRKAEVEAVKHFISKQEDMFRPAYARTAETFRRQCIFIGTTNNKDFLTDSTGNRRFLPIDVHVQPPTKNVWTMDPEEVNQLWAEAVHLYKKGQKLYLEGAAESAAKNEQKKHSKQDEREGIVEGYLNTKLPRDWDSYDITDRLSFLHDELSPSGTELRDYVCIAEIWCECLGKDKKDMDRYKTRDLHEVMRNLDEWERSNSTKNFKLYGKQKYYQRKLT